MGTNQSNHTSPSKSVKPRKMDFKIRVAIDFGTDGCALAFAYNDEVIVYNKWKSKSRQRTVKAKCEILLNEKDEVVAFGDNARIIYSSLSGDEKSQWKFFDKFKMYLYGADIRKERAPIISNPSQKNPNKNHKIICGSNSKINSIELENEAKMDVITEKSLFLTSANGAKCEARIVFQSAFKHLQDIAREYMGKITNNEYIHSDEIQWIITVPAIWSEIAKSRMKEWVSKAGLIKEHIIDQCLIVYEPDCGALAMFDQIKQALYPSEQKNDDAQSTADAKLFTTNSVEQKDDDAKANERAYILLDAGGGTVDIVSHKIVDNDHVEEIHYPIGGKLGACYIDDKYIELLRDVFSREWMDEFMRNSPNIYLEIISNFQSAKSRFYKKKKAIFHGVDLPYEFVQFLHKQCMGCPEKTTVDLILNQYKDNLCNKENDEEKANESRLKLDDETLMISVKIWKRLFDKFINEIIAIVQTLLHYLHKESSSECKFLGLVGGFSSSRYFQHKMNEAFGKNSEYKLIVKSPKKPSLSVVTGAAYFGLYHAKKKHFIRARIMKYTYGIKASNCFQVLARKNERITINSKKTQTFYANGYRAIITLLCSDKEDPKILRESAILGEMILQMPVNLKSNAIVIEFLFADTLINISAYPESKQHESLEFQINYGK